jgi:hypothetical protein
MYSLNKTDATNALNLSALQISQGKGNNMNDDGDYIYYNVNIVNLNEPAGKEARFSENRVIPILNKPSDYQMACVRFQLPSINIPILFFNNFTFSIKLKYGVTEVIVPLVYIVNGTSNAYFPKLPIYDYIEIVNSLNIAFTTAKTLLNALVPAVIPFDAPFVTYNAESQLFDLNTETAGYDNSLPNKIEIIFSSQLFVLFCNLQDFYIDQDWTQIIVQNVFNNSITYNGKPYLFMRQSQSSLELWPELTRILILSPSIPTRQELQPTQDDVTKRILFDVNISGPPDKGLITYFLQSSPRFSDLLSDYPLTQFAVEFVWADARGEFFPIYINLNDSVTAKFLFQKKIGLRLQGF